MLWPIPTIVLKKNMKIMIDTNVLLDCLLDRHPFSDDAQEILEHCARENIKLPACRQFHLKHLQRDIINTKQAAQKSGF